MTRTARFHRRRTTDVWADAHEMVVHEMEGNGSPMAASRKKRGSKKLRPPERQAALRPRVLRQSLSLVAAAIAFLASAGAVFEFFSPLTPPVFSTSAEPLAPFLVPLSFAHHTRLFLVCVGFPSLRTV